MGKQVSKAVIHKTIEMLQIAVSEEEEHLYFKDLEKILDLIEQLNTVDTELQMIPPLLHPLGFSQRLREDEVTAVDQGQMERFQAIAPQARAGHYLVPIVVGQDSN